jgi:hypothetical protein
MPTRVAPTARRRDLLSRLFAFAFLTLLCLAWGVPTTTRAAAPADDAAEEAAADEPADDAAAADAPADDAADAPADDEPTEAATDAPADEPTDEPADLPADEPADEPLDGGGDEGDTGGAGPAVSPLDEPQERVARFPEPSPYPLDWELRFDWEKPRRIVVELPGSDNPVAYWYLPYTVTNQSGEEQVFLPRFEMVTEDGRIHVSDRAIPKEVFDKIKRRDGNRLLERPAKVVGAIRLGEDEARDSVAIWREPNPEMGTFTIFVSGLSGEFVELKDDDGKLLKDDKGDLIILRKTLQLTYTVSGDEVFPGIDPITEGEDRIRRNYKRWIMR